jgi:hypothetical protein
MLKSVKIKRKQTKLKRNNMSKEIPRRNRLDLNTPAELAIHNAIQEVEKLGASTKLTEIVMLLQGTKEMLSDFVDDVEVKKPQERKVINDDVDFNCD